MMDSKHLEKVLRQLSEPRVGNQRTRVTFMTLDNQSLSSDSVPGAVLGPGDTETKKQPVPAALGADALFKPE